MGSLPFISSGLIPRKVMVRVSQDWQEREKRAVAIILLLSGIRGCPVSFLHDKKDSRLIRIGATLVMVVVAWKVQF